MAMLIQSLAVAGARRSDGSAVASGLVYLYSPGTTSPVSGYRDNALSQTWATTNGGIQLDSGGRASIWVNQKVDVAVYDSSGALVLSIVGFNGVPAATVEVQNAGYTGAVTDPATGAVTQGAGGLTDLNTVLTSLAASAGGTDGQYLESPGATPRKIQVVLQGIQVTPQDFGAAGDGVADDTIPVQKMLNELGRLKHGVGRFAAGTYKISSLLTLPASLTGVALVGDGYGATLINQTAGATDALDATGAVSLVMRGIQFNAQVTLTNAVGPDIVGCQFGAGLALTGTGAVRARITNTILAKLLLNASPAVVMVGCDLTGAPIISLTGACGTVTAIGCTSGGGGVVWAAGSSGSFYAVDCPQFSFDPTLLASDPGIFLSNAGALNFTANLATGSPALYTVPTYYDQVTINANSNVGTGAITPTPLAGSPLTGKTLIVHFINATGAAVTWNMGAWKVASTISGTDGNKTSVGFYFDGTNYREMWRAVTT